MPPQINAYSSGLYCTTITQTEDCLSDILNTVGKHSKIGKFFQAIDEAGYTISKDNQLAWDDKYFGETHYKTGYIEGIEVSELTKPIMWGKDGRGRFFISICITYQSNGDSAPKIKVLTFSEKYANSPNLLSMKAGVFFIGINEADICEDFLDLIHGKKVSQETSYETIIFSIPSTLPKKSDNPESVIL